MADIATTSVPTGSTLATTIAYVNSNITLIKNAVTGSLEGRGAATPNLASRSVEETTVAHNASVCTWGAEYAFNGLVVSGGTYSSASGLDATYTACTAWIKQTSSDPDQLRRVVASSAMTVTLEASSDNYVYFKLNGTLDKSAVATGAGAPTLPADVILLGIATTGGSTVTGTPVDKRVLTSSSVSKHYRSTGFWPYTTSTTNLRVPPGVVEIAGTLYEKTDNNDLDIATSGNFASGARTSNVWTYFIVKVAGGALSFKLTTSAPSAMTIVSGATSGATGRLQYRTISGDVYRYLGAARTSTTGVFKIIGRTGPKVFYNVGTAVLTGGNSTSSAAVALTTVVPPTARIALFDCAVTSGGANDHVFFKESSVAGVGVRANITSAANQTFKMEVPTSSAQKIMYRVTTTSAVDLSVNGYTEALD